MFLWWSVVTVGWTVLMQPLRRGALAAATLARMCSTAAGLDWGGGVIGVSYLGAWNCEGGRNCEGGVVTGRVYVNVLTNC